MKALTQWGMWGALPSAFGGSDIDGSDSEEYAEPRIVIGLLVHLATHVSIIVVAAALTQWAPLASLSGLPKLKSFLNGTYVRGGMLSEQTLVAKVLGITLVVASGLPLGKEGPMVHIGAMTAAIITRKKWPGTHKMLELRLPQPQREWIGMGAAAGVAAAFNAPFGGILYSFEEVRYALAHAPPPCDSHPMAAASRVPPRPTRPSDD